MLAAQPCDLLLHLFESSFDRGTLGDEDNVDPTREQRSGTPKRFPNQPFYAIALDRFPHLLAHRDAEPCSGLRRLAPRRHEDEKTLRVKLASVPLDSDE